MNWENIGGYSLLTIVMAGAGWLVKMWLESKIKGDVEHRYKEKDAEFQNKLSEKTQIAITNLNAQFAEKLKSVEHGYNEQLEKLRAQLQNESFKLKEETEHDRKIFDRLISHCDEIALRDFCATAGNGFYENAGFIKVSVLEHHGIQDENQFVNQELRSAFLQFHKSLDEFTIIAAHYFFPVGENRYLLYPELKHGDEEQRRIYEKALSETQDASEKALDAFSEFRQAVKRILYI
ncbi:MAG: hypothetical protein JWR26_2032 [Pedosphaera sp.]|nr:hypothetical protein [Pedosphaera sp.]